VVGLNAHIIVGGYGLGAALLALWLFFRYPRLGPSTLGSAILTVGCAQLLLLMTGKATAAAQGVAGPVVALVGVSLPLLVFPFWAALRLIHVANNRFKT
jgi:lipopolysaccharide export LptBFGC system permease protein LptF